MWIIAYGVSRVALTLQITAMRDEEDRSGHTPSWSPQAVPANSRLTVTEWISKYDDAYGGLWHAHVWVERMFWISILIVIWHAWLWLDAPVLLPR